MKNIFQQRVKNSNPRLFIEILLYILSIGMGLYYQWEIGNLLFFLLLLRLIIFPIPSRFPAGAAIVFLILAATLLFFEKNEWAEAAAIRAYYAMILTMLLAILEFKFDKDESV